MQFTVLLVSLLLSVPDVSQTNVCKTFPVHERAVHLTGIYWQYGNLVLVQWPRYYEIPKKLFTVKSTSSHLALYKATDIEDQALPSFLRSNYNATTALLSQGYATYKENWLDNGTHLETVNRIEFTTWERMNEIINHTYDMTCRGMIGGRRPDEGYWLMHYLPPPRMGPLLFVPTGYINSKEPYNQTFLRKRGLLYHHRADDPDDIITPIHYDLDDPVVQAMNEPINLFKSNFITGFVFDRRNYFFDNARQTVLMLEIRNTSHLSWRKQEYKYRDFFRCQPPAKGSEEEEEEGKVTTTTTPTLVEKVLKPYLWIYLAIGLLLGLVCACLVCRRPRPSRARINQRSSNLTSTSNLTGLKQFSRTTRLLKLKNLESPSQQRQPTTSSTASTQAKRSPLTSSKSSMPKAISAGPKTIKELVKKLPPKPKTR